ncbi:MAG: hypothetical protein LW595_06675 [Rickettsiales bacterium]|nr:hypothetical protein [Rickettsiales bacterium]
MKNLKKSQLNKTISNQITNSSELFFYLRAVYSGCQTIGLKSINGNLNEVIVDGEPQKDFAVLKTGDISNGKSTIKYYVLKLTN